MRYTLLILCLMAFFNSKLKACHGLSLIGLTHTISSTGITISGSSDQSSCGCGPYWMQVGVSTSPSMSGSPNGALQATLAGWPCVGGGTAFNSYPWFNAPLNIPDLCNDQCVLEPYHDVFIPFSSLTCGGVYYFAVREWVSGSNSAGPWSAVTSFTVPSNPGADLSFSLAALSNTICEFGSTALSATNIINGPITSYIWSGSAGTTSTVNVSPNVTTTYSLTATNGSSCLYTNTVTVAVIPFADPAFTPANPIICSGDNIIFNAVGSASLSSHYWDLNPNTGYTVNNSTVTPTPDISFTASGNYVITHTIVSNGCSYTNTTNILVNTCTSVKETFENTFSIYPNPSHGVYHINYDPSLKGSINIEVCDLLDKIILKRSNFSENEILINQPAGIYLIRITDENKKQYFKKLVIE